MGRKAEHGDYHFAAKLVRGAYMAAETIRAEEEGVPSPIHSSIENTHGCYDSSVRALFQSRLESGSKAEVMLGTHNQASIEKAIQFIEDNCDGDGNQVGAHFAQLLGMRDNLTYALGKGGYNAYKYVPYGKVNEVLPYLIRRAQENSDVAAGMGVELAMIRDEIKRRVLFR